MLQFFHIKFALKIAWLSSTLSTIIWSLPNICKFRFFHISPIYLIAVHVVSTMFCSTSMNKCTVASDQISHRHRMNYFEIRNWKSAGRRAPDSLSPKSRFNLRKGWFSWDSNTAWQQRRWRCEWQCLSTALHTHEIGYSTSGEGWICSISLSLIKQKWWATLQKKLGAQVETWENFTILLSQGYPRIFCRIVLQIKWYWYSKSIIDICGSVVTF